MEITSKWCHPMRFNKTQQALFSSEGEDIEDRRGPYEGNNLALNIPGWIRSQIVFYLLGHFYDFLEKKGGTAEIYP